jgi:hypothetical protein
MSQTKSALNKTVLGKSGEKNIEPDDGLEHGRGAGLMDIWVWACKTTLSSSYDDLGWFSSALHDAFRYSRVGGLCIPAPRAHWRSGNRWRFGNRWSSQGGETL